MRRVALDAFTRLVGWLRRHRRLAPSGSVTKVNLGSALLVADGWINLDASINALAGGAPPSVLRLLYRWTGSREIFTRNEYVRILRGHRFVHHDFRFGLPFDDNVVDYVYSSHLLEHLHRDDAVSLLRDVHRILKPGGVVRICVPDLAHALGLYNAGKKEASLEYFFSPTRAGTLNRHQYMYDAELLAAALRSGGFADIERRAFREGDIPDLPELDNRPEETLYMEARKSREVGATRVPPAAGWSG
jgi:SAM-dependent methyltransferase